MADTFPSRTTLEQLAKRMNAHESRYLRLGVVDCRFGLLVANTGTGFTLVFDTYGCTGVEDGVATADFVVEADSDVWQAMYDDIVTHGRASRDQTINYLTLPGINMRVHSPDQLNEDLFSRYNQTFQSFFDEAGGGIALEQDLAGAGATT